MGGFERLEAECTGGRACFARDHIEGCYTGEGDPWAVKGRYVADLRQRLEGTVDALDSADLLADAIFEGVTQRTLESIAGQYRIARQHVGEQ